MFNSGTHRPGLYYCLEECRQGYGKKYTPEAPETTKNQYCSNNGNGVKINRFRKNQGHQDIAVNQLQNSIGDSAPAARSGVKPH